MRLADRLVVGDATTDFALWTLGSWPARRWFVAAFVGCAAALAVGVPTGIVETSLYTRMTPVTW